MGQIFIGAVVVVVEPIRPLVEAPQVMEDLAVAVAVLPTTPRNRALEAGVPLTLVVVVVIQLLALVVITLVVEVVVLPMVMRETMVVLV
tara:strand:- start:436 stop:702 length:267 start_codon:yes stop_codon:yes gene_type:complete